MNYTERSVLSSTKAIREKNVNNALGTLAIEGLKPTEIIMELMQKYINGEIEPEGMLAEIKAKYKQN